MWKSLCSLFKKDCRMMMSGKFFLVALGSLVLYTLFINFGYVKFMDAQLYNVYLYDPAGMQTEVSSLVRPVSSLEELNNALASDTNGVGIDASGKTPHVLFYAATEKADRHRTDYALSLLSPDGNDTAKTVGSNSPEMKQRREITCELLFIEIVAVGFLGIASVLFKEKQMGVIRVHAIMPLHKSLFVCSKIMLFLITDLVFAALMVLFNVGLDGMSVLPAVLVQTAILSLIMALAGFGCTMLLRDFKQFSLAYLVIALFAATPVFLAANTSVKMAWIDYHPFYHVYAKMRRGEYQSVICPYGYRKSADGRMEPDEDVASNVQMIFQWASEGNTATEITRKLYAMNIPTPGEYRKLKGKDYYNVSRTNGVWSTSTVLRILEDQRYIGTYVIGKRKVKEIGSRHTQLKDESEWFKIPNHHPAIVSVDLFEKANASVKRFSLSNKKPRDYLLRGKVFCGCCDHAMSLRNGAWFYCRHSEVAETLPCHGVRIKMADLEQVVFETIRVQMCPALGIDSNKDKLDLQTVQQAEHEEKLRSIQDSKRHLYEQYALGEIDLETYRTRKAVYDTELVQAKNVHAVITAQTKQIKSDYEIKLKQQEIVQEVGNANMLTKALIDRLINKVYVFPGDRIEIEYATQDFLETKESEKEV